MDKGKSLRVKKVAVDEIQISGYTRPYTQELMAAGAEWDGRLLVWRYKGATLPARIQNIIIGQFSLMPETPMTAILDEPTSGAGETRVVNFKDVLEYWDKTRQKWTDGQYVYIGRANGHYHLPTSRWANNHVMQDESQRQQVIDAYRQDLLKMDRATLRAELKKLAGKTLVCWCKKADQEVACHGDVLVEFIKNPPPLEVVVHESAPIEPAKPAKEQSGSKIAEKLRKLAEGMQKEIDHKNRSYPFESQPPTYKRVNEYLSRKQDARYLLGVQTIFRALADAWDAGTIPDELKTLTTAGGIRSVYGGNGHKLHNSLMAFSNPDAERVSKEDELEEKRLEVALRSYDDYFPTSMRWLQDKMIEAADIQQGDIILEPSAGTGHLAQAIRAAYPENKLICIERVWDFVVILELQKFDTIHGDFLEGNERADVILMNPPFTNMADIEHVYHAFEQLNPGGRLVSIMSVAPFFNQQKKAAAFRQWFSENGGHMEKLREGAFKDSERSTGVATVMIVMRKPQEATEDPVVEYVEAVEAAAKRLEASEPVVGIAAGLTEINVAHPIEAAVGIGTMPEFIEETPDRQAIVERFRERMAEGEEPLDAAIGALDEAITNPTSAVCAGCGKSAMYTVERNGKPYCEECLPTPGGLPKQDAEWIKTGVPASSKPDVTTVEGAAQILYGPKPEDAQPLTYDDYTRIKSLYPDESQIVMLHVGAMWTTWDDDAETLEMAMKASQKGVRHPVMVLKSKDTAGRTITLYTADLYVERFEEAVKAAKLSLIKVNKDGSVRICNTLETASQNAQNINSTSTLVVAPQVAENAKNDATAQKLTALVNALRKTSPSEKMPLTLLYVAGEENVLMLFEHYVAAIRHDDPDIRMARAKEVAAAVILYQYAEEWANTDIEHEYPDVYADWEIANEHRMLLSIVVSITGAANAEIATLRWDTELMEHIVDVVAQTPF